MPYVVGQSALIVPVPDVEPIVGTWRADLDSSAAFGMPAHLTVVYPFLPASVLSGGVAAEVRSLVGARPAMTVTFARLARFPGVLYLEPSPDEPIRTLVHAVVARWPEAPPYSGEFADPIPHLTVSDRADSRDDLTAEQSVAAQLPFTTVLGEAALIIFDGTRWTTSERFPFLGTGD